MANATTTYAIAFMCATSALSAQVPSPSRVNGSDTTAITESRPSVDRPVVAMVGERSIYADDLDRIVRPRLVELEDQTYRLRRAALDSEIDKIVIETIAQSRKMSTAALRKELATARAITDEEVDQVYQKSKARHPTLSEADAKEQIRAVLEREIQKRSYRDALDALRRAAPVDILLRRPMIDASEFARLSGPTLGSSSAEAVRIVIFSDYKCPYCRSADDQLAKLLARVGDRVQLVYQQFPLNHAQAPKASEAALCAAEQNAFGEYHAALFRSSADLSVEKLKDLARTSSIDATTFQSCLDSGRMAGVVERDRATGISLGVHSTPTLVIDRELMRGLPPPAELDAVIERAFRSRIPAKR